MRSSGDNPRARKTAAFRPELSLLSPTVAGSVARFRTVAKPFELFGTGLSNSGLATHGDNPRGTEIRHFFAVIVAFVANCRRGCRHRQGGGNGDKSDTSLRSVALSPPMPRKLPFALNAQSECCESRGSAPAALVGVDRRDPLPTPRAARSNRHPRYAARRGATCTGHIARQFSL